MPAAAGRPRRSSVRRATLAVLALVAVSLPGADVLASRATQTAADVSAEAQSAQQVVTGTPTSSAPTTDSGTTTAEADPGAVTAWPAPETPAPELGAAPAAMETDDPTASASSAGSSGSGGAGAATGSSGWLSGASGPASVSGAFAAWRGSPVDIQGTWSDNNQAMVNMWQLQAGGDLGSWRGPLDIAIGAFGAGETWQAAATGAYDARWSQSLTLLKNLRAGATGPTYIRFAHEMNGNWYPWSVDSSERSAFLTAWGRFRDLQQAIFPESQLVFCLNRESVNSGFDWRQSFPGADEVDVLGVDYYNQWPYASSAADFTAALNQTDQYGAPKGLQAYADFARSQGLPLAVPEWSGVADQGDSPGYIQGMHDFFASHAGSGPGQVRYEILFDVDNSDYAGNFILSTTTRLTASAEAYRRLF